jgi:ATP-dependent RNA helicase DeaD
MLPTVPSDLSDARPRAHADGPATFADLGFEGVVLATLDRLSHAAPTPVQAQAIPVLLAGRDLVVTAATGTGKTGAFALRAAPRRDRSTFPHPRGARAHAHA